MIDWPARFQELREESLAVEATPTPRMQECLHPTSEIRRKTTRTGQAQLMRQCLTCGDAMSSFLPHNTVESVAMTPAWDEALSDDWWGEYHASRRRPRSKDWAQSKIRMEWKRLYQEYLASPEWASVRGRVMVRAREVCEGCGLTPARVVHHKTYDHIGDELLFELVALCRGCHDRAHKAPHPQAPSAEEDR